MNKTIKSGLVAATCLFTLPLCFHAQAQISNKISANGQTSSRSFKELLRDAVPSNITFNYYAKYLGPGVSGNLQQGATYNRFSTGQSWDGSEQDFRSSEQIYQSFRLGYKLPRDMIVSYGVTYQDNIRKGIQSDDGERSYGRSFNNHRVALWVPNIYDNGSVYLGSSFFTELPTTQSSRDKDMQYGLGIQPTLGFYSGVAGLSYGVGASLERVFYPDNEFMPSWCKQPGYSCKGVMTTKRQVLTASITPFMNYSLNDQWTLSSTLSFDWDQDGDQAETLEFGNNMNDAWTVGASYLVLENLNISAGIEGSLTVPHIDRTAMFASMGISI